MSSKHTPGPWEVRTIDNSLGSVDTVGGVVTVAQAQEVSVADRNLGSPERKANARLIAAAPDLLEALQSLVACITSTRGPNADAALHASRLAILKATGA